MIGKIERVALREVWKHEAIDFTRWLEENVEVLNEVIDLNLVEASRERNVGDFSLDLVAQDDAGNPVVIENQLERSDHDHLGKLLTYAAALEAAAAIWIVARPRPEHVKAIQWLNELTELPFYLVQVEAVRIGDSGPAPLLTKIVGPSTEARAAGEAKRELSESQRLLREFWTLLLSRARQKTRLHSGVSPQPLNWIGTGAGISGLAWNYSIRQHDTTVELYLDRGKEDENLRIFEALYEGRERVDTAFGSPLKWDRLEARRACRISYRLDLGGWKDGDNWEAIADATIDAMIRLEAALGPFVKRLSVG